MGAVISYSRTLRATLCEIERGVFYATYPDRESAALAAELTNYQIGASAADAKRRIELSAQALGYETVSWTETIVAPLFASLTKTVVHEPAATNVARHGA
jgi:hypothetical protein